jgi:glycosyltransferase involved in cell wall biosynthesis
MINPPRLQATALKVGFVTPSLEMGGAERWIMSLAKNMRTVETVGIAHVGHKVHRNMCKEALRICPVFAQMGSDYGMTHVTTHRDAVQAVVDRSDLVIVWGIPNTRETFEGFHVPIIDVSHLEPKSKGNVEICNQSWRGATHVAAISEAAAQSYPDVVHPSVTVIYNGAEVDRMTPRRGRKVMRDQQKWTDDDRVLLHMGRLYEIKHPDWLIQSLAKLPSNWYVALCGNGDAEVEAGLFDLASTVAPGRVRFFPSSLHVGDYLAMADVYGLLSEFEGFPLAMIEAWLAGVPCVVTEFGVMKELQRLHGDVSIVLPSRPSIDQIAEAVLQADKEGRSHERVVRARSVAWHNYTASAMAFRWESYLIWTYQQWQNMQLDTPAATAFKPRLLCDRT